jgi:hypothetical protein
MFEPDAKPEDRAGARAFADSARLHALLCPEARCGRAGRCRGPWAPWENDPKLIALPCLAALRQAFLGPADIFFAWQDRLGAMAGTFERQAAEKRAAGDGAARRAPGGPAAGSSRAGRSRLPAL